MITLPVDFIDAIVLNFTSVITKFYYLILKVLILQYYSMTKEIYILVLAIKVIDLL